MTREKDAGAIEAVAPDAIEADSGRRDLMKAMGRWAVAAPVMAVLISAAGRNPANAYLGGD